MTFSGGGVPAQANVVFHGTGSDVIKYICAGRS
jgi:hypothetical protein